MSFGQYDLLSGFDQIYVEKILKYEDRNLANATEYDRYFLRGNIENKFNSKGFKIISKKQYNEILNDNTLCQTLFITALYDVDIIRDWTTVYIEAFDCNEDKVFTDYKKAGNDLSSTKRDVRVGVEKLLRQYLDNYKFNSSKTPVKNSTKQTIDTVINFQSELSIKNYLDNAVELDPIEGIWIFSNSTSGNYGRSAIIKDTNDELIEIHLENLVRNGTKNSRGEVIASIRKMSEDGIYIIKENELSSTAILKGNLLEVFYPANKALAIREYPINKKSANKNVKKGEWAGNGSGIIISQSGHIVTNYHVIKDTDEIEVEFILNEEVQKFNAEIVTVDKLNDLAIIKIFDMNFDGLDNIGYNFKIQSSDVGTKVYAYGYPMALTAMGKEIKITDGIISSKSGFDGNITTYQITAPIQAGNSGGPLFDENGNFIGINSSGLGKDVADNVGYTIKSSYVLNLLDVLPKSIDLPSNNNLESLPLTDQIKEISKYVVLIKVK